MVDGDAYVVDCGAGVAQQLCRAQLLHQVRDGDRATQSTEQMHMIGHAADPQDRAIQFIRGPAEHAVHFVAQFAICEERPAVVDLEGNVLDRGGPLLQLS